MMCENQPKDRRVIAWLPLGIMLPVIAMDLPRFFHPSGGLSVDWFEGLRGLLAGIGFGMMIMVVVKLTRQSRHSGS
jgi:hypothetical protein